MNIYKKITVIIVSFNSSKKIEKCLSGIDTRYKKIVIENTRDLNLKKKIERKFNNSKVILNSNKGFGAANNLGVKIAKTKYVLITSPDVILKKNTIKKLFIAANKLKNDFSILSPVSKFVKNKKPIETKLAYGYSFLVERKKFKSVGGFDSKFFLYYEDEDLSKRMKKKYGKIYLVPNARVNHLEGGLYKKKFIHEIELCKNWHYMWSKFYFNKKHNGKLSAYLITLPFFMRSVFRLLIYFFLNNNKKFEIYNARLSGLFNAYFNKKSWYRPIMKA